MWHVWVRRQVHLGFWWEDLREGYRLEDLDVDRRIILNKLDGEAWTGLLQ